jgi:hypothetical protein
MGAPNTAWYDDRVAVPFEAFKSNDSAPPNMFRSWMFVYPEPSAFPTSTPVFADILPRSAAFMKISISVGVDEALVGSGRPMKVDIGSLNISAGISMWSALF